MSSIDRRRFLAGSLGMSGAVVLGGCSSGDDSAGPSTTAGGSAPGGGAALTAANVLAAPGAVGLLDEAAFQRRVAEYFSVATETLDPGNVVSIGAHLAAARRDPDFVWDPTAVTVDSLEAVWNKIDTWEDTRDFRLMELQWVLGLADAETAMTTIDPAVLEAAEQRMVDNRYRWNDPLPADRIDNQWFWSENHLIIGLVNEYVGGMRLADRTFPITGLTGAEHAERSRQPILDWITERAKFGFFEWHSHVYMQLNVAPLLTLAEFAEDPELVLAAGMGLDLCVLDMAAFCHAGVYAASRGRSYAKDKLLVREPTFEGFKLLFDDTDLDYGDGADLSATYFAASSRYRAPQVLVEMATAEDPGVVRERHGIFVDGTAPITDRPEAPFGYDFDDPENLSFWWSQGMVGVWQMAETNLAAAEEFRFFETDALRDIATLVALNGNDPAQLREFELANHAIVNFGHLREANTYGFRSDQVSLATVVDHRFGEMRDQIHAWEATVGPGALVFTTHPRSDPPTGESWTGDTKPGYWTGEASIPRSAQHERTAIHIYQPKWDETTNALLWAVFGYRDFTHAYVPQDRFDEVIRQGRWTFARKDDGYVALWSWREPNWRATDPSVSPTDGQTQPFDLVAEGGADNVWIVEVGDPSVADSFADFVAGITASEPSVERDEAGFTVGWTSPTSGAVTFGSTAAFVVDGEEQALGEFPRHESRWGTVERLEMAFSLRGDDVTWDLDFDDMSRAVGGS